MQLQSLKDSTLTVNENICLFLLVISGVCRLTPALTDTHRSGMDSSWWIFMLLLWLGGCHHGPLSCYAPKLSLILDVTVMWHWSIFCMVLIWNDHTAAAPTAAKHHQLILIVPDFVTIVTKLHLNCLIFFFFNNTSPHALGIFITFYFCPLISHQGVCKE